MHHGDQEDPEEPGRNGVALTEAFTALRGRLVGTAYFVLGHREDAREAVQEAFLKCWRRRDAISSFATLDSWIFSVTLNAARDVRRRRRVRRATSLPEEDRMPASTKSPAPPAVAERRDLVDRLRATLHVLPEREREVFLLRQNGELTYRAIAEIVGAPVGTVKTRMRSALKRLRQALTGMGRKR